MILADRARFAAKGRQALRARNKASWEQMYLDEDLNTAMGFNGVRVLFCGAV